jgi:hypothetical protein
VSSSISSEIVINSTKKKNERDNKRKRRNDNDDEKFNSKIYDEEKEHKVYIVINFEILTIMNVMFRQIAYWVLNTICFQHNVQNRSTFIFYTTFSKLIFVSDLKNSTIAIKQDIVRLFCKISNKRMNIFFLNAFYVLECSFNLINFDQLNDLCSMTYKFEMFIVENQNIIAKKHVNNVFFLSCESTWIITSSSHLSSIISNKSFKSSISISSFSS